MRVQGGTEGIISAIISGRLDPLSCQLFGEHIKRDHHNHGSDKRETERRMKRRAKRLAARARS